MKEIHGHILMIGMHAFCSERCIKIYHKCCADCLGFPGINKKCNDDVRKRKRAKLGMIACDNFREV